jgi:hypothetical protein
MSIGAWHWEAIGSQRAGLRWPKLPTPVGPVASHDSSVTCRSAKDSQVRGTVFSCARKFFVLFWVLRDFCSFGLLAPQLNTEWHSYAFSLFSDIVTPLEAFVIFLLIWGLEKS